jgi:phosphatidylserine/phosphatidylglycerophosphate/cardiolipin synthase-like enzyme
MTGFDLDALLKFTPPEFLCENCFAIMQPSPHVRAGRCPICETNYMPTAEFPNCADYLRSKGLALRLKDPLAHGRRLAKIAHQARLSLERPGSDYPPMRALLEALTASKLFVHFTTYGVSALLIGAIKLTAQRVPVRGVISGVRNESLQKELTQFTDEAPLLDARLFPNDSQWFPHQKIIVIDGLLAFKGSANLTDFGWRKAAQGREVIEVVTDLREVTDLHNRFFSGVWSDLQTSRDQIVMSSF